MSMEHEFSITSLDDTEIPDYTITNVLHLLNSLENENGDAIDSENTIEENYLQLESEPTQIPSLRNRPPPDPIDESDYDSEADDSEADDREVYDRKSDYSEGDDSDAYDREADNSKEDGNEIIIDVSRSSVHNLTSDTSDNTNTGSSSNKENNDRESSLNNNASFVPAIIMINGQPAEVIETKTVTINAEISTQVPHIPQKNILPDVETQLDKKEHQKTRTEKLIYNYYSNSPDDHIVLEPHEHKIVYKWALYGLSHTDVHDEAIYDAGLDPNHIRKLLNNCQHIKPNPYFTCSRTKIAMHKWMQSKLIEKIPEYIPADCVHYYNMSHLLLESSISPYEPSSDKLCTNKDGYYWVPIRAIYSNPVDDILYTSVFIVICHELDYAFMPKIDDTCSTGDAQHHVIGLDMPAHNFSDNEHFTEINGGIVFKPLINLYLGIDDVFSIGAEFGYPRILAACERANWKGLFC